MRLQTENAHTKPEWNTDTRRFYCVKNGFGQYWPIMETRPATGGSWYQVIIRDSNPFKTLAGAERFVENVIKRLKARSTTLND